MKLAWLLWLSSVLPQPQAESLCLATTIYLEARGQPIAGQLAVAEVALRRRDSGRWGKSLCTVLTMPGQFALSTTDPRYVLDHPRAWRRAWQSANQVLDTWNLPNGQRVQVVPGASHFVALADSSPAWAQGTPLATIGDHSFFRVQ